MLLRRSLTTNWGTANLCDDYRKRWSLKPSILNDLIRGVERGFQELPCAFPGIAVLEYGTTCDQDLGASAHYVRYAVVVDAAVHFNTKLQTARLPDFRKGLDFLKGRLDEGLTAKAGIHAHDKHVMNERKDLIKAVDWGGRIDYYAGFASMGGD